jgi:transposase
VPEVATHLTECPSRRMRRPRIWRCRPAAAIRSPWSRVRRRGLRRGLRKDLDAVTAGLTLPYSDGPSEGANTKVKLLKRQMYGRAGFSLLRQRILLS